MVIFCRGSNIPDPEDRRNELRTTTALPVLVLLPTLVGGCGDEFGTEDITTGQTTHPLNEPPVQFPTLSRGSRGDNVRALQHLLKHRGFNPGNIDGAFGSGTDAKVRAFQRSRRLSDDGVVGPGTWSSLTGSGPALGARGEKVLAATRMLHRYDNRGLSYVFSRTVEDRLKAFQRHQGLSANGRLTAATWKNLAFHYELYSLSRTCAAVGSGGANDLNGPNNRRQDGWGTGATIAYIERAAARIWNRNNRRKPLPLRDLARERGGDISGHRSHKHGMDVDAYYYIKRAYANSTSTCNGPIYWTSSRVDSAATIEYINELIAASEGLGRDLHRISFTLDNIVLKAFAGTGEVSALRNHGAHTHSRFCTVYYPYSSAYDC